MKVPLFSFLIYAYKQLIRYNDPKYFSSCFKKKFKVLPRDISQE